MRVSATAASDVVLRTLGACLVGALAFPVGYHPIKLRRAVAAKKLYLPIADGGDPTPFLRRPPRGVVFSSRTARRPVFRPDDGVCEDLRFESPFSPLHPDERARWASHPNNRTAHARWFRHHRRPGDAPRPTILAVHGFSADLYHLNEWFFALPWFYRMGCDVLLFTLPFHGKRQAPTSPFSGYGFFSGGVAAINEAFAQGVSDLRTCIDWLQDEHGVEQVGITGVSLGGYTSALLATVEDRLSFVIPNVPVTSLPDLVMQWEPIGLAVRASLVALGRTLVDARELLAVSSPLTYKPVVPRDRLFIVGGVADRLAPPQQSRALWEHWGRCAIHWFPGSHLIHLDRGDYLRQIARFLGRIGFLPKRAAAS